MFNKNRSCIEIKILYEISTNPYSLIRIEVVLKLDWYLPNGGMKRRLIRTEVVLNWIIKVFAIWNYEKKRNHSRVFEYGTERCFLMMLFL